MNRKKFQVVPYRFLLLVHRKKGNFHIHLEYYRVMNATKGTSTLMDMILVTGE